jgi:hypothetical protein
MRSIVFFTLPPALPEAISPALALEDLGRLLCRQPLASEKDLETYQRFAMEEKVVDVISQLLDIPAGWPIVCPGQWHRIREPCEYTKQQCRISPTTHAATVSN